MCLFKVRVPTHLDGRSLYWEFATDGYDIGFGLFFEWVDPEDTQVGQVANNQPFLSSPGDCAHLWQWGWVGGVYNGWGKGGGRRRRPRDAGRTQWAGRWNWASNFLHNSYLQVRQFHLIVLLSVYFFQEGLSWGSLCRFTHLSKTRSLPTQVWQLLLSLEIKNPLLQGLLHQIIWVRY